MTDVAHASSALVPRAPLADARDESDARALSPDPWVRSDEWSSRWRNAQSPGTQRQYDRVWDSMLAAGSLTGRAPLEWRREDVTAWTTALREIGDPAARAPRPLAPATVAQRLSAASSYYAWCLDDERSGLDRNPVPKKGRPKAPRQSRQQYLTPPQVRSIVRAASDDGPVSAALLALLLCCLRVSEACAVRVEDFTETGGHRVVAVTRKGGRADRVPVPPQEWRRISALIDGRASGPLFVPPVSRHAAHGRIGTLGRRAGVPGRVTPHTFRHAAITFALEAHPLHVVQQWAGHEDPRTTERYWRQRANLDGSPAYSVAAGYYEDDD